MDIRELIAEKIKKHLDEVIAMRRHLHKHPELSQCEYETARFVSEKLANYGIENQTNVGKTGVVGLVNGKAVKPTERCVALRADMDALPIEEANDVDYKSINSGVMHACGHDFHTAALLGVARVASELSPYFNGQIKLIFQPSEEMYPGGARMMIDDGVLENPRPDIIIAQHVIPQLPAGTIGFAHGECMASTDEIHITVKGKGGHAAMPHNCIDTILIASHVVIALQQIVSRRIDPNAPVVLTIGNVQTKGRTNVIPEEVLLSGTLRTYNEEVRTLALNEIKQISEGVAMAMGGSCSVRIVEKYPPLINDEPLTTMLEGYAREILPSDMIVRVDRRMTAEDFAIFARHTPSCFYRIGTGNKKLGSCNELHTPNFNVDDDALYNAVYFMTYSAIRFLNNN